MAKDQQSQTQFEDCVDVCADSLYRVALRMTGNATLASELVQETYLAAWRGLDSLQEPERMRAWMFSILRFQYTKLIRRESKSVDAGGDLQHSPTPTPSDSSETVDRVRNALAVLPDKHKFPLLLVSMEGLSVEEAAEVLELPRGTVLSRLHRGRQKLKEQLLRDGLTTTGNTGEKQ